MGEKEAPILPHPQGEQQYKTQQPCTLATVSMHGVREGFFSTGVWPFSEAAKFVG